jgi:biofilm PGA synthesis N-glycosyltransferase PgaC
MAIFLLSLLGIIYVFAGYPILLRLLARQNSAPEAAEECLSVTAVLVVCNEQENVIKKLDNLFALDYPKDKFEVIVVDDASTDSTIQRVLAYSSDRVRLLKAPQREGKSSGLNRALGEVSTELTLMVDARQTLELDALKLLSAWFTDSRYGLVSGELCFRTEDENGFSQGMDAYWRYEKAIRKAEASIASVPGVTGAVYVMRTEAFQPIPADTLIDDVLIPMNAIKAGYRVGFDDRAVAWDVPSTDSANEKRRKIRTITGNYQLLTRHPVWCLPGGHPIWWQYLSHKMLRLAVPFLGIMHLISALTLAAQGSGWLGIYSVLFMLGLASYPLSLKISALNDVKILRLASSFVALNWFNFLGCMHFLFMEQGQSWKK